MQNDFIEIWVTSIIENELFANSPGGGMTQALAWGCLTIPGSCGTQKYQAFLKKSTLGKHEL